MKVLVTGVRGQLGYDVVKVLKSNGHIAIGVGSNEMDITNKADVERVMETAMVDAVIHCAAYTAVDVAEDNEELCRNVNVVGTENIAKVCKKQNIKMLYLSTDYVFHGEGMHYFKPEDEVSPLNIYGRTKYEGELVIQNQIDHYFIVRISWVFGLNGNNFVKTMLRLGKERGAVSVVNDQIGSPTYTKDLAVLLVNMIETNRYGIYHATNEGICSWYEYACEIFKQAKLSVLVTPIDSDAYKTRAKRPKNSRMNKDKLIEQGFDKLPDWQDALYRYLKELEINP